MIARNETQSAILAKLEAFEFQNPAAKRIAIFLAGAGKTIEPENIPEHLLEEICQAYESAIQELGEFEMSPFIYSVFCDLWGAWTPEDYPWFDEGYDPDDDQV